MTASTWALLILCAVLAGLNVVQLVLHFLERQESDRRKFTEQRELITRIQRPDLVPVPKRAAAAQPPPVRDEFSKVGIVSLGNGEQG